MLLTHQGDPSAETKNVVLDILFRQITTFINVSVASIFGLKSIDFSKIYQLKGLKPKNKGHMNFYEHCDMTKKYLSRDIHIS